MQWRLKKTIGLELDNCQCVAGRITAVYWLTSQLPIILNSFHSFRANKKVKMTVQNQVLTFKEKKTLQTRKAEVEQIRAKVKI